MDTTNPTVAEAELIPQAIEKLEAALRAAQRAQRLLAAGGPIRQRRAGDDLEMARWRATDAAKLLGDAEQETYRGEMDRVGS